RAFGTRRLTPSTLKGGHFGLKQSLYRLRRNLNLLIINSLIVCLNPNSDLLGVLQHPGCIALFNRPDLQSGCHEHRVFDALGVANAILACPRSETRTMRGR
ncbi:MAG: hypothetical protein AAFQ98_26065, partial [Bacteroidota bacterium]